MRILLTTTPRTGSTVVSDALAALLGTSGGVVKDVIGTGLARDQVTISDFEAGAIYGRLHRDGHVHKLHSIYLHHALQAADHVDDMLVVNVMRDFKDVYVSRYFYERYYAIHREDIQPVQSMLDHLEQLKEPDDRTFLNSFVTAPGFLELLEHWADFSLSTGHPKHLRILYADVVERPDLVVRKMIEFLGTSNENRNAALESMRFQPDDGYEGARFRRKGVVGDHKTYLAQRTISMVDELVNSYLSSREQYMSDPSLWSPSVNPRRT